MTDSVYDRFYTLLEQKTGICLDRTKQYLIDARLANLMKASDSQTMVDFMSTLIGTPVGDLHWQAFEALTTNETLFFRDRPFFDALTYQILPGIIQPKKADRNLRISCSAVSTGQIQKFFTRTADGRYEVTAAIRDAVTFLPSNLLEPSPAFPKFDLILLRNVLIYFSQATKDRVLEKIHRQLNTAGGVLALGSTESILSARLLKIHQYGKISYYTPL